ncbi:hypothetical protein NM688_g3029 [Phlebia brevispora]|uniref:Uncharacterized protein n=1 Tax=Phlebia brevispora TaxID=194682 RepID=A0ACC1T723_9APHY|nr:hypothetical protein NM688_g3029 [Phlebia brevispora]
MAQLPLLVALISTAFRLAGYLFLRVIPSPRLRVALVTLYSLYLPGLYFGKATSEAPSEVANGEGSYTDDKSKKRLTKPKRHVNSLQAILFSLPSPSRSLTIINVAINTVILLLAADFVMYPVLDDAKGVVFTRVGAVYPDSVKLAVRYPAPNATENNLHILWRQVTFDTESSWHVGPAVRLTAADDWVSTARLDGLWPSTTYEYVLSDEEYRPLAYPAIPVQFHTFPDPRLHSGSHFRFVVTSCATPNFPYRPFHGRTIKGFDLLADYLWPHQTESPSESSVVGEPEAEGSASLTEPESTATPEVKPPAEFMLFLGDFIYADVPLYFGDDAEAYRRLYRRNYQSDSFRRVYEHLPMFHTYDDHEIINNYVGEGNDSTPPFANAADAFRLYNADANYDPAEPDQHYYDFRYADVAFFVMDTRRYRSDITKTDETSGTMLGDKQLSALYEWLGKASLMNYCYISVTSVPFTSLWQHDAKKDSWAAYPYEKISLLNALHSVPNVVFLSGDRHEFAAIKFTAEGAGHDILEVSTSPLSMFYVPFVRTLRMKSETTVKTVKETTVEGNVVAVEEEVPQEQVLKYLAEGNYKWSSLEIDTRDLQHPVAHLEVVIDGTVAYRLAIAGKPVNLNPTTALGNVVPTGFKGVLEKMGLKPSRWFS